uniref:Uncharacterized protein n=1 Tax=Fundulus heteroclitus TaxID=8078 RepID=A0A3Q2PR46_FUNHE
MPLRLVFWYLEFIGQLCKDGNVIVHILDLHMDHSLGKHIIVGAIKYRATIKPAKSCKRIAGQNFAWI